MAYWGMAQALSNFPRTGEQATAAIEKAKSLASQLSGQEQHYIRATAALIENPTDEGRDTYVREMQALIKEYPSDLNAPRSLPSLLCRVSILTGSLLPVKSTHRRFSAGFWQPILRM